MNQQWIQPKKVKRRRYDLCACYSIRSAAVSCTLLLVLNNVLCIDVLYSILLRCIVFFSFLLYCIVLCFIALYCVAFALLNTLKSLISGELSEIKDKDQSMACLYVILTLFTLCR